MNFLGCLFPIVPQGEVEEGKKKFKTFDRVYGMGTCEGQQDAEEKIKEFWFKEHPDNTEVTKSADFMGGVFVFPDDMTIFELMEKADNKESVGIIEDMYNQAVVIR